MKRKIHSRKPRANNYYLALAIAALGLLMVFAWLSRPQDKGPQVRVFFYKGEKLVAVERPADPGQSPLRQAAEALLAGPSERERGEGLTTMIPAGVKAIRSKTDGPVAIIDLSRQLEEYGGGSTRVEGIVAQLVYTATELPGIDRAWLWVEGQRSVVLGGEGLVLDRPLSRQDVKN
jgi:spore germination protein GerM